MDKAISTEDSRIVEIQGVMTGSRRAYISIMTAYTASTLKHTIVHTEPVRITTFTSLSRIYIPITNTMTGRLQEITAMYDRRSEGI
jgi:hypothetical protein